MTRYLVDEQGTTDSVRVWHAVGDTHDTRRLVATFHREHHPDAHGAAQAEANRLNRDEADHRARRAAVLGAAGFPDKAAVVATGGQGAVPESG